VKPVIQAKLTGHAGNPSTDAARLDRLDDNLVQGGLSLVEDIAPSRREEDEEPQKGVVLRATVSRLLSNSPLMPSPVKARTARFKMMDRNPGKIVANSDRSLAFSSSVRLAGQSGVECDWVQETCLRGTQRLLPLFPISGDG